MKTLHASPVPSAPAAVPSAARLASILDCGPKGPRRNRKLPPPLALALFLQQCLDRNLSLRAVLSTYGSELPGRDLPGESAYCQARSRLSLEQIACASASVASRFERVASAFLKGRLLLALDAADFTVEDTAANRSAWTYPSGQKAGCGFPVLSALFSLALDTGEMRTLNLGKWSTHDLRLALEAPAPFEAGAIHVGDRIFGTFVFAALCRLAGGDAICRVKAGLHLVRNRSKRLGPGSWLVEMKRPEASRILSAEQLAALPETLAVRLVHAKIEIRGHRTEDLWVVTTLLDPVEYPDDEILLAYGMRWDIELAFRDVKTSMCASFLRTKTPEMAEKAVRVFILARNLVRLILSSTRLETGEKKLSFKTALPVVAKILWRLMAGGNLWRLVAARIHVLRSLLYKRRKRPSQPRAGKLRKQHYPYLTAPRGEYIEIPHIKKYRKGA